MEGFKPFKKVQCFREGGSVQKEVHNFTKRDRKNVEPGDLSQDKKLIKKAFKQHDRAEHDKEPTEIKLKKGGRAKKETGTVKKYKAGGKIGVYGAKKKSGDMDSIEKAKDIKPKLLCGGKSVKKMADGGIMDALSSAGTTLKNNVMGTPEQNRIAQAMMDKVKARKAAEAAALMQGQSGAGALQQGALAGGLAPVAAAAPQVNPMGDATGAPPMKKGGKVKKYADGGDVLSQYRATKKPPTAEMIDQTLPVLRGKIGPDGRIERPPMNTEMIDQTLPVLRGKIGPDGRVERSMPKETPGMRNAMLLKKGGKVKKACK